MISRLADGSLARIYLSVHLISTRLISSAKVREAIAKHGANPGFEYRESTTGYHVLLSPDVA